MIRALIPSCYNFYHLSTEDYKLLHHVLEVVTTALEIEDIEKIFFQVTRLKSLVIEKTEKRT